MKKKEQRSKKSGITSFPPLAYAVLYLINIFAFSLIYAIFFNKDFNQSPVSLVQSFYFSVVTTTTLGYGDITPKLEASSLLLTITSQVILGVVFIGLFLNAISHKLSDRKDFARQEEEKEIEANNLAKLLTILKPVISDHLGILAETYKVTTTQNGGFLIAYPHDIFNQGYYDQISRQDFLSNETRYGKGVMTWGHFIDQENTKFILGIDDFLNKYATTLPMDLIELLVSLKSHQFLQHCKTALKMNSHHFSDGVIPPQINLLTIEHSSVNINEKPNTISEFHEKLLTLITLINEKTQGKELTMTIDLREGVTAPSIGSAISEIIRFGPF
ncbi:voltage-gated potassium channel [compost metagenome]